MLNCFFERDICPFSSVVERRKVRKCWILCLGKDTIEFIEKKCTVNLRTRENVFCCVFVLLDGPIRKSDQTQKLQSCLLARKAELWAFEELKLTCIRMPFYFLFFLRIWLYIFSPFSQKN